MDCVNHSGVNAIAYCQNCGKPLCADCVASGAMRNVPGGQILCDSCITAWQSLQPPFAGVPPGGPNPAAAGWLGLIPGVGAMYNGQFVKGFIHVAVFAVLCALSNYNGYFGFGIPAWIIYQSFEAYHTAKALRDGQPVPDPFGLNEVGNWMNQGTRMQNPGQPGAGAAPAAGQAAPSSHAPYTPTAGGFVPPPVAPQQLCCRRNEPIGAIVLIALGLIFLLGQLDLFHGRLFEFAWPLLLIALGVWLIVRRVVDSQGGSK
jgi:hypothetical protein